MVKNEYKVNGKEQKQSMNAGVNELTREAILEKHVNITDKPHAGLVSMSPT